MEDDRRVCVSGDPADARRHFSGTGGVKCATGHALVALQAPHGNSATDEPKTSKSIRHPHRIGTWNVRGLNQPGKLQTVENEMQRKNVHLLGLSETHWKGQGHCTSDSGSTVYFSGPEDESSRGVAFIVPRSMNKCVVGYNPVSDRIITLKLNTIPCKLNIVQVYAPTAQSTEEEIEGFYDTLTAALKRLSKREVTIILGDFNAKVGDTESDDHLRRVAGKYGIGERNDRGERLLQFCCEENFTISNTCFKHHIRRLYTWISPGDRCRNQIDYILIRTRWRSSVTNATTYPGADCGSDHQLLVATIQLRLKRIKRPRVVPNMRSIELNGFRQGFEQRVKDFPSSIIDSDSKWEHFKRMVEKTATENKLVKPVMKDFITPETAQIILERRELKEQGLCSPGDLQRYSELSRQVQLCCRKDYDSYINGICLQLEQHSLKNEFRYLFQKVKELTGTRKPKTCVIEDKSGCLLTDVADVLDRWKTYCAELYNTSDSTNAVITWSTEEPDILPSEIEHAIKALKCKKTPGKDGITAELLKNLGQKGTKAITDICNTIWKTGKWPKDWTESVFIPLHKKGSSKDCGNYRTLALISHASKILLHVINRRLNYFLSRQIPEEQAGFVKGKGTREQILNVRQIIEKSREFNSPVILCFIDYTKAFDCVQWDHLWFVLLEMGVPEHLVALIQSLYTENRSFVRIGTEYSNMFQTKKGVRQGCILSPALFNIYGEYVIRKTIENWEKGFPVGGKRLSNLRYADDTVLLATSMEDMTELFQRLETESGNIGLAVNRSKTKVMIVDRAGTLANVTCNIPGINIVDQYIYLGSQICNDGSCVPEIKRRIGMAKDAMTRLNNIWKKRGIGIKTKIRLTRALVFPIFLYGVETWTILARERQRIDAFEMWCWRRLLRIPWTAKRTNVSILNQLKIKTRLSTICQQRILSYFGHTVRRGDESLEKLIVVGSTEGKRSRGRSPTRWTDQVKDSSSSEFYAVVRDALDRNRWRQIIRSRCYPDADHDPQI